MMSRAVDAVYLALLCVLLVLALFIPAQQYYRYNLLPPVDKQGTPGYPDFLLFYAAGQLVLNPQTRTHVYDPVEQYRWQSNFLHGFKIKKVFYMQHVPFIFPLMVPFALLPAAPSFLLWTLLSVAAGIGGLWLLGRLKQRSKPQFAAFAVAMFFSLPCCFSLWLGQKSLALFFLVCLFWWCLSRRKDYLCGIALAFTSISPHYAVFLSVPALVFKRWRVIASAVVAELMLVSLAGFTIGWSTVFNYPSILMNAESTASFAGVNPQKQICIRGLLCQFLPNQTALKVSLCFMLAGLAFSVWLWLRQASKQQEFTATSSCAWAVALTMLGCLMVSPHTHIHDWTLLAVPAWLTLPSLSLMSALRLPNFAFRSWSLLLLLYPLLSWFVYALTAPFNVTIQWTTIALFLVNLLLLVLAWINYRAAGAGERRPYDQAALPP